MADFQNASNNAGAALITGNRTLVTTNNMLRWAAQGKVFAAGQGLQTVGIDSQGEASVTPDDVKATFALQAPSGGAKLIVPLLLRVCWEVEGGAATDFQLIFTKASSECATTLALSGRDMVQDNFPIYSTSPVQNSPTAQALYGVATTFLLTVSALVDADNVMYDFSALVDNNVSVPVAGSIQQKEYSFISSGCPHILTNGAAMIFYISSATSDAVIHPYMQWAELDVDDLI